jgi:hypothetical protein
MKRRLLAFYATVAAVIGAVKQRGWHRGGNMQCRSATTIESTN